MKAALIGCGGMGSGHARSAPEHGVEVVAYCDVIEAAAERARAEFGGRYATADAGRIMRDDSIDLVIIATHHDAHHPLARAGARAGKHLLVEKPLCQTREQAIEVAEAVDKAGVKLIVNCKFRIAPTVQKAKELIPSPALAMVSWLLPTTRTSRRALVALPGYGTKTTVAGCSSARRSIPLTCSRT